MDVVDPAHTSADLPDGAAGGAHGVVGDQGQRTGGLLKGHPFRCLQIGGVFAGIQSGLIEVAKLSGNPVQLVFGALGPVAAVDVADQVGGTTGAEAADSADDVAVQLVVAEELHLDEGGLTSVYSPLGALCHLIHVVAEDDMDAADRLPVGQAQQLDSGASGQLAAEVTEGHFQHLDQLLLPLVLMAAVFQHCLTGIQSHQHRGGIPPAVQRGFGMVGGEDAFSKAGLVSTVNGGDDVLAAGPGAEAEVLDGVDVFQVKPDGINFAVDSGQPVQNGGALFFVLL